MKILLKNGLVYINKEFIETDVLIEDEKILKVEQNIAEAEAELIDCSGKHIMPGFIDLHAHLRDPGQTYKEDIVSGTKAAAKGGFTTICAMPNTEPIVDNIATVEYIRRKANDTGFCKVLVIGALTKKSEGKEISEMATMKEGEIIAVSDDGKCVQNSKLMLNCMKYASNFDLPVIIHPEDYNLAGNGQINGGLMATKLGLGGIPALAEEIIISRDIMLAKAAKCHLHVAHISTATAVEMVRKAKADGINITCEVTPHHLVLTENACESFDTNTKVKPPLRTETDRQALIAGLIDGTIDVIATDHAPHADYEKEREYNLAPFGINVFETAFASMYDALVETGLISLELLVERMSIAPAKLLKLANNEIKENNLANLTIADVNSKHVITADSMVSKSKNTPFIDHELKGEIVTTIAAGKITYRKDNA